MRKLRDRSREYVCHCSAYDFPHRFSGGACDGTQLVDAYWTEHQGGGDCTGCHNLVNDQDFYCEVERGQEDRLECPALQEFLHCNEQKLRR